MVRVGEGVVYHRYMPGCGVCLLGRAGVSWPVSGYECTAADPAALPLLGKLDTRQ